MPISEYRTFTQARDNLKAILDAAESGRPATITRDGATSAMVAADRLRDYLAATVTPNVRAAHEDGAWALFIPGLPIAAEATDYDDALNDLVDALRDYAEDWVDHLNRAPNHADNWGVVNLILLSDDDQLRRWAVGEQE
jgi:antitoxin (DNA-binding transcriptional repressor) of toxin-antitoxin stability system